MNTTWIDLRTGLICQGGASSRRVLSNMDRNIRSDMNARHLRMTGRILRNVIRSTIFPVTHRRHSNKVLRYVR